MSPYPLDLPPGTLPRARPRGVYAQAALARRERNDACVAAFAAKVPRLDGRSGQSARIKFIRVQTRGPAPDGDNLVASCKHVRDGVLDVLHRRCGAHGDVMCGSLHDGMSPPGHTFEYAVEIRRGARPGCRVEIEIVP